MRKWLRMAIYPLALGLVVVLGSSTVLPQTAGAGMVDFRMAPLEQAKKISKQLQDMYFEIVQGKNPKYREWCTPVF